MNTLLEYLVTNWKVSYDDECQLKRPIAFAGLGWYSMDDAGVYRLGELATTSRIKVEARSRIINALCKVVEAAEEAYLAYELPEEVELSLKSAVVEFHQVAAQPNDALHLTK